MPDFFEVSVSPGDVVLLCSDGLSNMMDDSEIYRIVLENRQNIAEAGGRLLTLANEYGGRDNISILLAVMEENQTCKAAEG